jgi:uncharacterized membrane protein HdeD (DUF308 family)
VESGPSLIQEQFVVLSSVTRNWWTLALRGTLAVIFGVIAFAWPGVTFEALVLLFGVYAFLDGVLVLSFGLMAAGDGEQWWPLVLSGILGIGLGVLTFARPEAMGTALVYVVGFWAIVTGLLEIVGAIRLRGVISGEWMMGLSGALSILFGVLVVAQPNSGARRAVDPVRRARRCPAEFGRACPGVFVRPLRHFRWHHADRPWIPPAWTGPGRARPFDPDRLFRFSLISESSP